MGPALHISGASGGACPSVTTGSGAPDADLAARGEVTLVINGTAVAVPRDRGGNLAGAGVGVGAALPFTFGALSGAALLATGSGDPGPPPPLLPPLHHLTGHPVPRGIESRPYKDCGCVGA